jgi:DnaK suppressor protein
MAVRKTPAAKTERGVDAPAKKPPVKKTGAARGSARGAKAGAPKLAVRSGEKPWTVREIAEVRSTLESDAARLHSEITEAEQEIAGLMREGGEGAGHDQADVGSNTFERDHEMTLARNARENLQLVREAITRIENGTYGVCESCGQAIGKARLQAFPRATLCMECKQRQERR